MTSSSGTITASIAAIIASVATHETMTSVLAANWRPNAADCFRAIAVRSCGPPHVVAHRLVDARLLRDRDDTRAHDVARDLSLLGEDIRLRNDADHMTFIGDNGRARDALGDQGAGDLLDRRVLAKSDHVSRHHILDRDHQLASSVATVWRLALPPLRIRPVRARGSLPEM